MGYICKCKNGYVGQNCQISIIARSFLNFKSLEKRSFIYHCFRENGVFKKNINNGSQKSTGTNLKIKYVKITKGYDLNII